MKRILSIIGICACVLFAHADSTVIIPLKHYEYNIFDSSDDSGSSTVDPIDPNQAKVELTGNTLKVYEGMEGRALITLANETDPHIVVDTCFNESITLTLTDTAQYCIHLHLPSIGSVYGTFRYPMEKARKVMQDGSVYIFFNNQIYTPFGVKMW